CSTIRHTSLSRSELYCLSLHDALPIYPRGAVQRYPIGQVIALQTSFGQGWRIREARITDGACGAKKFEFACIDKRFGTSIKGDLTNTCHHVLRCRCRAPIGHVENVYFGQRLEQFSGDMHATSDP